MALPPTQTAIVQPNSASLTLFEMKLVSSTAINVPVNLSAAAIIGATSITVTALTGAIPAGTTLHFTGQDVVTTAAAASAATTLTVLPLTAALLATATSTYDGFTVLPITGGVNLAISDASVAFAAYVSSGADVWDYNVKTAMSAKATVKTAANDNDPAVSPFVAAGLQAGVAALVFARMRRASGSYYTFMGPLSVTPADPERGIAETMFTINVSGKVTYTPV